MKTMEGLFDTNKIFSEEFAILRQRNKELGERIVQLEFQLKNALNERDGYRRRVLNNPYKRKAETLCARVQEYRGLVYDLERETFYLNRTLCNSIKTSAMKRKAVLKRRKTFDPSGSENLVAEFMEERIVSEATTTTTTITIPDSPNPGTVEEEPGEIPEVPERPESPDILCVPESPPPSEGIIEEEEIEEEGRVDEMAAHVLQQLTSSSDTEDDPEEQHEEEKGKEAEHEEGMEEEEMEKEKSSQVRVYRRNQNKVCGGVMRAAINGDKLHGGLVRRKMNGEDILFWDRTEGDVDAPLPKDLSVYEWKKDRVLKAWKRLGWTPHTFGRCRTLVSYGAINAQINRMGYKNEKRNKMWARFLKVCPYLRHRISK
jgi:hypothetical protein